MTTLAEYHQKVAEQMLEKELLEKVRALAKAYGYLIYHTHRSERSEPGFPDLTLVHPKTNRLVFAELKKEKGHLTDHQKTWHQALLGVWVRIEDVDALDDKCQPIFSAHIWRPSDLLSGSIEAVLRP